METKRPAYDIQGLIKNEELMRAKDSRFLKIAKNNFYLIKIIPN